LKGLGYGLDQQALNAARSIAFEPQIENGKPISVVKMVQYSFAIY
jgi:outer membrane biosynthesis protein TonB